MSAFRKPSADASFAPAETLLVPTGRVDERTRRRVEYWSPSWGARPTEDVCCGIRPLSGADDDYCRLNAAKTAWRLFPGEPADRFQIERVDAFNDALMRIAITRGTCDANDARKAWDVWGGAPDDVVGRALTREGVKAIYDAIERITLALSPVRPKASDEECARLFSILRERLASMPTARADRARRLLGFLLDECDAYAPTTEESAAE